MKIVKYPKHQKGKEYLKHLKPKVVYITVGTLLTALVATVATVSILNSMNTKKVDAATATPAWQQEFGTTTVPGASDHSYDYGFWGTVNTTPGTAPTSVANTSRPVNQAAPKTQTTVLGSSYYVNGTLATAPSTFGYQNSIGNNSTGSAGTTSSGTGATGLTGQNLITGTNTSQIVVAYSSSITGALTVQNNSATGLGYYPASDAGFRQALYDIYTTNNSANNYVIYFGSSVTLNSGSTDEWTIASPSATDMNLYTLKGRAASLTFTSSSIDPVGNGGGGANNTVNFGSLVALGTPTAFRNMTYTFANGGMYNGGVYAEGNAFATEGGSLCTSYYTNYFGGSTGAVAVSGDTNMWIQTTNNTYYYDIFGGNDGRLTTTNHTVGGGMNTSVDTTHTGSSTQSASTNKISGSTHVTITGITPGGYTNIVSGGNYDGGTISGNTNLQLIGGGVGQAVPLIYGGGLGTANDVNSSGAATYYTSTPYTSNSGAAAVTVSGSVYTDVLYAGSSLTINGYVGGVYNGTIGGTVYNNIQDQGAWTAGTTWGGPFIIGGSTFGNIGNSSTLGNAIFNNIDLYSKNTPTPTTGTQSQPYFCGANGNLTTTTSTSYGITYGNIVNSVMAGFYKTGTTTFAGTALYNVRGGVGRQGIPLPTNANAGGSQDDTTQSTYVLANPTKSSAIFGNIYTWIEGGDVESSGPSSAADMQGGSFTGYVKGNTTLEVGRTPGAAGEAEVAAATTPGGTGGGYVGGTGMALGSNGWGGNGRAGTSGNIGEEGYYYNNPSGASSTSNNPAGSDVNMEMTGGGDTWDDGNTYFQAGNSTLVQNNDIAGWTYGAGMKGEQWGDSYNIGNEMMVSTLEGSGWYTTALYGNSFAIINNGVVGWFLSGGSWETQNETGNATVQVYKGSFPNAYVGGNYGNTGNEIIQGNSKVSIYGGDFQSAKALCGAAYYGGSVRGNSLLSLNLSGPNGNSFVAPTGIDLSGGSMTGTGLRVGTTGAGNTIGLKIILPTNPTAALATALASDTFFIDGSNGSNTQASSLNAYVTAYGTGSTGTIGTIAAENYSGLSGTSVKHNSNITIGTGITIQGAINGLGYSGTTTSTTPSGTVDSLTNNYFATNQGKTNLNNYNVFNGTTTGVNIYMGDDGSTTPINVNGTIENFSSLNMDTNSNVVISGQVLNGSGATAANHYIYDGNTNATDYGNSYSNFGTVTENANSKLTVNNTTMAMSMGKLQVIGMDIIQTAFINNPGVINLSYLDLTQGAEAWLPTTQPGTVNNSYNGYYWGAATTAAPVLTFTGGEYSRTGYTYSSWQPSDYAPNQITPATLESLGTSGNFYLSDFSENLSAGGQTTSTLSNYYTGYFTPGQRVEYQSTTSDGAWSYTMSGGTSTITSATFTTGLSPGTGANGAGGSMAAYSDVNAATGSSDLMFEYPASATGLPTVKVMYSTSNPNVISSAVESSVLQTNGVFSYTTQHDYAPVASYASSAYTSSQTGAVQTLTSNPTGDLYTMNSGTTMQLNASVDTPGSKNPMTGTVNPNTGSWLMTVASTAAPTLTASDAMIAQGSVVSQLFNSSGVLNQQALENMMLASGTGLTGDLTVNTAALTTTLYNGGNGPYLAANQSYIKVPVTWTNGTATKTNYLYVLNSNASISGNDALVSAQSTTISYAEAQAVQYDTSTTENSAGVATVEGYMNVVALELNTTTGNMSVINSGISMTGQNYAADVAASQAGTASNGYFLDVTATGSPKVVVGSNTITNTTEIAGSSATSSNVTGVLNGGSGTSTTAVAVPATNAFLQAVNYAGNVGAGTFQFGSSTDVTKGIYFSYTSTDGTTLTTQHTTTNPVTLTVAGTAAPVLAFTQSPGSVAFGSSKLSQTTNISGSFSATDNSVTPATTTNDAYGNPATYIGVQDTLNNGVTPWELQVTETTPLTNTTNSNVTLEGDLFVNTLGTTSGTNADLSKVTLTGAAQTRMTLNNAITVFYNATPIANNAGTEYGNFGTFVAGAANPTPQINWATPFTVNIPAGAAQTGTYNGKVTWTLTDTP